MSRMLVYVAGYGRSGSTLLDSVLGTHGTILGAGELARVFDEIAQGGTCACGQPLTCCQWWKEVGQRLGVATRAGWDTARVRWASHVTRSAEGFFGLGDKGAYIDLWERTLSAMFDVFRTDVIVDSSKTSRVTWRRLDLLSRISWLHIKVLHLTRDPRQVMRSVQRGSNRLLELGAANPRLAGGVARGLAGWVVANIGAELGSRGREVLRVQYEALISDPKMELGRIGEFLGLDMMGVARRVQSPSGIDPGHGIAGNRMRRAGARIRVAGNEAGEWTQTDPWIELLAALARPLAARYGYSRTT